MNILRELRARFVAALTGVAEDAAAMAEMVRPSADAKFGDYQANFAMPLGKQLNRPPRDVAADVVARLDVAELCEAPEVAGPGFINLKLKTDWLADQLRQAVSDERLGVEPLAPRTYVIDYSSPNVAKPMHVGHIRSTVIGAALYRTLKFLGHRVISDNHIGDWGTQFGMIIYGYKHFADKAAYAENPVAELSRLYRFVNRLVDYHAGVAERGPLGDKITRQTALVAEQQATQHPAGRQAGEGSRQDATPGRIATGRIEKGTGRVSSEAGRG